MSKIFKLLLKWLDMRSVCVKQKHRQRQTSLYRFVYIGCLSFLLTLSLPFIPYSLLSTHFLSSQVLAQSTDAKKAEADRLFKQGSEQYKRRQKAGGRGQKALRWGFGPQHQR